MIKEVKTKSFDCEDCVFDGKFECLSKACCEDPINPIKYINVTD